MSEKSISKNELQFIFDLMQTFEHICEDIYKQNFCPQMVNSIEANIDTHASIM